MQYRVPASGQKGFVSRHVRFLSAAILIALSLPTISTAQPRATGFVKGEIICELGHTEAQQLKSVVEQRPNTIATGRPALDQLITKYSVKKLVPLTKSRQAKAGQRLSAQTAALKRRSRAFTIQFKKRRKTLQALKDYKKVCENAQLNYVYTPDLAPSDEYYPFQYTHQRTDAESGWDIETGSSDVVIAVIGVGVDYNHSEFNSGSQIWQNTAEANGSPNFDDDGNGFLDDTMGWDFIQGDNDPAPIFGDSHETAVAGIAAGHASVGTDGSGLASACWGCKVMPIRAAYTSVQIAAAVEYAVSNGAKIVNMSFGNYTPNKYGPDSIVEEEINIGTQSGVVMVATAGNNSVDTKRYPAALPNVIAVAATNSADTRASFSNFGAWVSVAAPGDQVLGATADPNQPYNYFYGTSYAAPYVSGLAGLLLSKDPTLSPQDIHNIIRFSTDTVAADQPIGTGRVNVANALAMNGAPTVAGRITAPLSGDTLAGAVDISGAVLGESYLLEFRAEGATEWEYVDSGDAPEEIETLGTAILPPEPGITYQIRLQTFTGGDVATDQISITSGYNQVPQSYLYGDSLSQVYADTDGDGDMEFFISEGDRVKLRHHNGVTVSGWPVMMPFGTSVTSPGIIGDIDGNPGLEVVFGVAVGNSYSDNQGMVYAYHHDGTPVSGFPVYTGAGPVDFSDSVDKTIALADLNGDEVLEVIVVTAQGVVNVLNGAGQSFNTGWPVSTGQSAGSARTPVVADFDGDGEKEIAVLTEQSLQIFEGDGSILPSFPVSLSEKATNYPPIAGDIDLDGVVELVISTEDTVNSTTDLVGVDGNGTVLFTSTLPGLLSGSGGPVLGDLNNDRRLEIVLPLHHAGEAEPFQLHLLDIDGTELSGWPVAIPEITSTPLIVDVDQDPEKEIVFEGHVFSPDAITVLSAYDRDGNLNGGFPIYVDEGINSLGSMAGDFDNDGDLDIAVATVPPGGVDYIRILDLATAFDPERLVWSMPQVDRINSGMMIPANTDPIVSLTVTPPVVVPGVPFTITLTASSPKGVMASWWYGNNTGITDAQVTVQLPAEPSSGEAFTTEVETPTTLDRAFGSPLFNEASKVYEYTFTSEVIVSETGTLSFGANVRDAHYGTQLSPGPHQASEAGGIELVDIVVQVESTFF